MKQAFDKVFMYRYREACFCLFIWYSNDYLGKKVLGCLFVSVNVVYLRLFTFACFIYLFNTNEFVNLIDFRTKHWVIS